MRLIDADAAKADIRKDCPNCTVNGSSFCKTECIINRRCDFLDEQPTVEPEIKRPYGNWILCEGNYFSRCSICGDIWLNEECNNYCPKCGSYMRSENNVKK